MKRPSGLWILLSAGVLWLSLQDVYGIRATALIFGKSSTTTTEASIDGVSPSDENVTESTSEENTTVNSNLTGNPQLDYIYDPNLPKELNGYNLSEYPFYERVPEYETIDFKCDGLHDGFYASIAHKCQVYHHCLDGTRYDFLCANFTAFDQKLFNCQFVSKVDCINSVKYWDRNEELYKPASTTTTPRPYNLNIYTRSPDVGLANSGLLPPSGPGRPAGGRRRPMRRRRPLYDYYEFEDYEDDYYDERPRPPRRRKQRPRPRRPVYDDEDEEYEDQKYERRRPEGRRDEEDRKTGASNDRRGADDRRPSDRRKNKDRRKYEDDVEDEDPRFEKGEEDNKRPVDEDRRPTERKRGGQDRYNEKRRPAEDDYERRPERPSKKSSRRPIYEDEYDDEPINDRKTSSNSGNGRRKNNDRPVEEDSKTLIKPQSGTIYDRPRVAPRIKPPVPQTEAHKYSYKSVGGTAPGNIKATADEEYYDEYEEEPLPKNLKPSRKPDSSERGFKPTSTGRDENKENRKQIAAASRNRSQSSRKPEGGSSREETPKKAVPEDPPSIESRKRKRPTDDEEYYEDYEINVKPIKKERPRVTSSEQRLSNKKNRPTHNRDERPSSREEISTKKEYGKNERTSSREERPNKEQQLSNSEEGNVSKEESKPPAKTYRFKERTSSTTTTTSTTTTSTTEATKEKAERDPVVRIVKRPFLPSRGGNPYSSRGLQPVGTKALDKKPEISNDEEYYDDTPEPIETKTNDRKQIISINTKNRQNEKEQQETSPVIPIEENVTEKPFKASPVLIKLPVRTKFTIPTQTESIPQQEVEYRPITPRPVQNVRTNNNNNNNYNSNQGPRTTQKPKVNQNERNPLDINENEYDVTLNDALNPTLPNLPVRGFPTGFSAQNDYTYSAFTRPRYVIDPILSPSSTDYIYQNKPRQRYEGGAQTQAYVTPNRDQYVSGTATAGQYNNGQQQSNFRSRLSQAQPQTFYSNY